MTYTGPRFTDEEREQLKAKVWEMYQAGVRQPVISAELDLSQSTICRWLQEWRAKQPTPQQLAAAKIRELMVCCDVFEQIDGVGGQLREAAFQQLRLSNGRHDVCFYGEWAARLAEQV